MLQHNNMNRNALPQGWRYTFLSVPLIDRVVPINKKQYYFDKKLGNGAFGSVYAARRLPDNKQVAIKVVSLAAASTADSDGLAQSCLTEILMAKRLAKTSRHIVHMHDFDFDRKTGFSFIVMERGQQDLEEYLSSRPPLSSSERKSIWHQLADVAITLHNRQIVHLDIKPNNLVVFPGNLVKLVDLGIAQKAQQSRIGANGTIPYSAPEVTTASYLHMTITSRKADVWSWGAVLYRMTYNIPPDYNTPCYRPPSNQHPARDPNLLDVLRHTLVKDPRERQDAQWLVEHPYSKTH